MSEDDLIEGLASHLNISRDAVEYRLANLGAWVPLQLSQPCSLLRVGGARPLECEQAAAISGSAW